MVETTLLEEPELGVGGKDVCSRVSKALTKNPALRYTKSQGNKMIDL